MISIGLFWLVVVLFVLRWMSPSSNERALPEPTRRLEDEVARLRDEVDRLSGQVQRLLDEQSFLLRLLSEGERPLALPREDVLDAQRSRRDALPAVDPPDQTSLS